MTFRKSLKNKRWLACLSFSKKNSRGFFSIVEMLVATAILLISVTGPIALIGSSVNKIYYARDEMIAVNIAQEGIEIMRQTQDSAMLAGAAWSATLAPGSYAVDTLSRPACPIPPGDTRVYQDANGYRQCGTGGTATPFTRSVVITDINTTEKKVVSTVSWVTRGIAGSSVASEYIFYWRP